MPYDLIVDGEVRDMDEMAYLVSPHDLAGYELVDDLSRAGVSCLKIEGRLKSAHYVAATTQTYRAALDATASGQRFAISPQQKGDLEQTFSRGFTHGFLSGVDHQKLVTARFPKSRGRRVGLVERVTGVSVVVRVEPGAPALRPGDGVVFDEGHPEQDEQGGRVFVVKEPGRGLVEIELGRGDVNLRAIAPGAIVWKTDDPAIRKRLEHSFSRDVVARGGRGGGGGACRSAAGIAADRPGERSQRHRAGDRGAVGGAETSRDRGGRARTTRPAR